MKILRLILCSLLLISALGACMSHPTSFNPVDIRAVPPPEIAIDLRRTIEKLAGEIGERNLYNPQKLELAQNWIEEEFKRLGYGEVSRLPVRVKGSEFALEKDIVAWNLEAILPGTDPTRGTIVVGAHYDSKVSTPNWHDHWPPQPQNAGTPGANDNASGIAAVLSLAKQLRNKRLAETIRFVAFVNEEPPFYQTEAMGSLVYARMLEEQGLKSVRMLTPETLGCYSIRSRDKRPWITSLLGLPDRPDYVAFLGNFGSKAWMEEVAQAFAEISRIEVRTLALPAISKKVAWSDDWSFWQAGFSAFAITDTAFLRHDDYHELDDVPANIDYEPMAEVVWALGLVLKKLAA